MKNGMSTLRFLVVLSVVTAIGGTVLLTTWEAVHTLRIEKIPARDHSLGLNINTNAVLADLHAGREYNPRIIRDSATYVGRRFDTSNFRLQSLIRIMYRHADGLSPEDRQTVKDTFLDFKYWMDQPGQDSMCYWSENHQLLFSASEYLAGQLWPEEIFTNTGLTGREHREMGRRRILTWLEQRWLYGFAEWYSNTYYVEDIAPLANLIDFAEDQDIVIKSKMILDLLLHDVATQSYQGTFISTSGRLYANGKRYAERTDMQASIDHVWDPAQWGRKKNTRAGMGINFILAENYSVPPVIRAIGEDEQPVVIKASTGLDLQELQEKGLIGLEDPQIMMQLAMESFSNDLVIENTINYIHEHDMFANEFLHDLRPFNLTILKKTGALPAISRLLNPVTNGVAIQRANTYTYRDPDFMVATAQAYHPGSFGDQQHLWNAVLSRQVSVFTTHPARPLSDEGALSGSPGYWVGSGRFPHVVQDENVVLNIFQPPEGKGFMEKSLQDFTHAHFPKERFDEVIVDGRYAFGRAEDTYGAFIARNPLHYTEGSTDDLVQPGMDTYWIFEAGSARRDGDFESFMQRIRGNVVDFENAALSYVTRGKRLELDYLGDFVVDGRTQDLQYPRFRSPYADVEREPEVIRISHEGRSLELDFYRQRRVISPEAAVGHPQTGFNATAQ